MKLVGSLCAIATPFDGGGELDLAAFEASLRRHREAGTDGVVVAGSTGESASLEDAEIGRLFASASAALSGGPAFVAGCGAANTRRALTLVRSAAAAGAAAALVVTPYYVRPTQEGLYRHYATLAEQGGIPVIAYNVPGRTGVDLLPETVERLVRTTALAGLKEARPERERIEALLPLRSERFALLSGDDGTCCAAMLAGFDGVISVAANVVPRSFAALSAAARAGRRDEAERLDAALSPLYRFLGAEPNPIPVKWLLARMGAFGGLLRLPLVALSAAHHAEGERMHALAASLEAGCAARAA